MHAGGDLYVDFLVSRLACPPSRGAAEATDVAYERDPRPDSGTDGPSASPATRATPPTSSAEWLRDHLLACGYSDVSRIYQGIGGSTRGHRRGGEGGAGLVNYLGHG